MLSDLFPPNGIPSRELTYPIPRHFWVDDFQGGICDRSLEGMFIPLCFRSDLRVWNCHRPRKLNFPFPKVGYVIVPWRVCLFPCVLGQTCGFETATGPGNSTWQTEAVKNPWFFLKKTSKKSHKFGQICGCFGDVYILDGGRCCWYPAYFWQGW